MTIRTWAAPIFLEIISHYQKGGNVRSLAYFYTISLYGDRERCEYFLTLSGTIRSMKIYKDKVTFAEI